MRYIRTMLRFTKEKAEVRKQTLSFVLVRYIRTFDVISEVIWVRGVGSKQSARICLDTL